MRKMTRTDAIWKYINECDTDALLKQEKPMKTDRLFYYWGIRGMKKMKFL